jgi:hypothetical protein
MVFSFRGKGRDDGGTDDRANDVDDGQDVISTAYEGGARPDADKHLKRLRDQHRYDPFMQVEKLDAIDVALETGDAEKETVVETALIEEDSPYVEVRAAVSPNLPACASGTTLPWSRSSLVNP